MKLRKKEDGAVLLVSMILLLITAVVGMSAMETSLLERKISTSRELKELAFQTAESAIEYTLDDLNYISDAFSIGLSNSTNWPTEAYTFDHDTELKADTEVRYIAQASSVGYSMRKGASGISTYYYEVESSANRDGRNISSTHVQGIFVEGPRID